MSRRIWILAIGFFSLLAAPAARGQTNITQQVGFDQRLNSPLPLDAPFRDEQGRTVALGDYFGNGRPVILTLVYYECPMLCTQELTGLLRSMNAMSLNLGKDFDVVTVSISPTDAPALAADKKKRYLARYGREGADKGWHFLTGDEPSIRRVAQAAGFRYTYNPRTKLYAHAAGVVVATPSGRLSRYYYGISYPARDLRLMLVDAAGGRIGSPIDKVMLLCYAFDPHSGRYTFAIVNALRVLGVATLTSLATFITVMVRRDLRRAGKKPTSTPPTLEDPA